ncbi:MAG TPA: hypothetical protein PLA68_04655, partial [Panacibacter sp.]|nr:hypothetical protein [Panacibacter sp.]
VNYTNSTFKNTAAPRQNGMVLIFNAAKSRLYILLTEYFLARLQRYYLSSLASHTCTFENNSAVY